MTHYLLRLAVIVLALLVAGAAYSDPPPPTPLKTGQHQEPHANQSAQNAKSPDGNANHAPRSVTLEGPVTIQKRRLC